MNTSEEEYITYVVVEKPNADQAPIQKKVKIMNTPEDEQSITYIAVEPAKAGLMSGINKPQLSGDVGSSANLEKVRDLLFGNQIRDFDKKFNRLEERLVKECASLRDDTRKRLDSIEVYLKQEVQSLTEGLKTEQAERDESVKEVAQEIKDVTKSLEKRITQLDEQTNQKQRDLRQQILDQSKSLDEEMRQKYEAILSVIEREVQELRNDKSDRSTLATLFTQMAMHLNNEYDVPNNR